MKKRNRSIDLWKLVFDLIIVLHHSRYLRGDDACIFLGGSIGVDFFFIVSGYLMVRSFESWEARGQAGSVGYDTFLFLKRKFCGLLPDLWVAWIVGYILKGLLKSWPLRTWLKVAVENIWFFTALDFSGLGNRSLNIDPATWYISAMLLIMLVLYPMLRKNKDLFLYVIAPGLSVFIFGILYRNYSSPRGPTSWLGFFYKGMARGVAEICLGAVCYLAAKRLQELRLSKVSRALSTAVELWCYLGTLLYAYLCPASDHDYIVILMLAVAVTLSFSGQSADYVLGGEKTTTIMAEYSFDLYLSHHLWSTCLGKIFPTLSYRPLLLIYVSCSALTALAVMFLSRLLKKSAPRIRAGARRLFLAEER